VKIVFVSAHVPAGSDKIYYFSCSHCLLCSSGFVSSLQPNTKFIPCELNPWNSTSKPWKFPPSCQKLLLKDASLRNQSRKLYFTWIYFW